MIVVFSVLAKTVACAVGLTVLSAACVPIASLAFADAASYPALATTNVTREALNQPLDILPEHQREAFFRGRALFRQNWVIAPARDTEAAGLGPLHNRISCIACHTANGKGNAPGFSSARNGSLLLRLSVPGTTLQGAPLPHPVYGDQLNEDSIPGVDAEGRVELQWHTRTVTLAGGEQVELRAPQLHFRELAYGPLDEVQTSARMGSPVFGLGLLEAVPDDALLDLAAHPEKPGAGGRINRVFDDASGRHAIGRFGLKSNRASLRDQIAAAMIGDLGITSSVQPHENCTPVQQSCRTATHGGEPELSDAQLQDLQIYLSYLAPPAPRNQHLPEIRRGAALFKVANCIACHRAELPLGRHALLGDLHGRRIQPYTDLLLHDMGNDLSDGRGEFDANGREWRTAPLWGIGLMKALNEQIGFMHDGRARTVQEAILWHGGQAQASADQYMQFNPEDRQALLAFIDSL